MQYKLIITGPVGAGKTTAINTLTDFKAVQTDMPVSDEVTRARKETTTVAMDYGTLHLANETSVHVYGTPGQERFDFMWEILTEGADALVILLDNSRNYPFRDLKFFSERFSDFIQSGKKLIIGITRLDVREPLPPEVYEDWMDQLGLQAEVVNVDPRLKSDMLRLVHSALDIPVDEEAIAAAGEDSVAAPLGPHPGSDAASSFDSTTAENSLVTAAPALSSEQLLNSSVAAEVRTGSTFELNEKAMAAISGLHGVTGVSITNNVGELLDSTIDDEAMNQFIAYLSGMTPSLQEIAELGPMHRIMLRGPQDDNLTVFVEEDRALGVCSERNASVPALSQQVEDMLQWL